MNEERMNLWKERLGTNESAYAEELGKMDHREEMFRGQYKFKAHTTKEDKLTGKDVIYVYNALAENIEAQVSADIPMPKVTARRQKDERLAVIIENMLRNELDRLPMERVNDLAERVVPLQGGGMYLVEWDNLQRTHGTVGETAVSFIHPKWVIPQNGVYTSVQDMDYVILKLPQTKEGIRARYGVDVTDESETEPEIKDALGGGSADEMVTQYVVYYRNDRGGVGRYSWVGDTELEDLEDYQARHLERCVSCGAPRPVEGESFADGEKEPVIWHQGDPCPHCGGRAWQDTEEESEEIEIGGRLCRVPYYKPDVFPLVLQRNVSVFGQLLGESDADRMEPLQDGINRLEQKIFDRMLKAGTRITLPDAAAIRSDTNDQEIWRIGSASDLALIRQFDFTGDVQQEMAQIEQIYQHMRQTIGITDSYQGRTDRTAASGAAKEFAAAQAAGRMESKRIMKQNAYAELFELMFKFRLAYADEPRPVVYRDGHGATVYDTFSKWDFLEQDEDGMFYWNDAFLFSCDTAAPLATNRERLWQETTAFFSAGAFGDPARTETQIEYWQKMELLHYPGAGQTRANLQERLADERARERARNRNPAPAAAPAPAQERAQAQVPVPPPTQAPARDRSGPETDSAGVEEMARRQALSDIVRQAGRPGKDPRIPA